MLSKRAARIIIEPWDPAVDKAVRMIDQISPGLLPQDAKIKVHTGGGPGQLGHVESGPDRDPREIHIFKDRIREIVMRNSGQAVKHTLSASELENAILNGLMETIIHERGHFGPTPQAPFRGEPEAEAEARKFMEKVKLQPRTIASIVEAASQLEDIRQKYLPNRPIGEPNLEFVAHTANNSKYEMVKTGLSLLIKDELNPAADDIENAIQFNKSAYSKPNLFGIISDICKTSQINSDFVINLAKWQIKNNITPTGKLNKETIEKISKLKPSGNLPRNFGVVVPNKIYRGGIIDDINQLENLKSLGVERVISLHGSPEIARMCNKVGIEHYPAFVENGKPDEFGRNIIGNSVSKLLLEKPCYVHCYFGQDRTGGVIARFRTENGWPCDVAYKEAKAHGFKDIFVDLIDWFSEPCGKKPIDTDKIRELLKKDPYENPELEQECAFPTPSPTDMPMPDTLTGGYNRDIISYSPYGIGTVPFGHGTRGM